LSRITVASWNFRAQIPSAAILGNDRFKYLGWWGKVNANSVAVRQGPGISYPKVGVLFLNERVKVLEEIFGEWVDNKIYGIKSMVVNTPVIIFFRLCISLRAASTTH